ncbi:hypothetical protein, partial [Fibrobacter sp.]
LIDRFLHNALECEADALSDGEHVYIPSVMEHVELAGEVGGQAGLGRQLNSPTPWLTERHGYDPTSSSTCSITDGM